MSRKRQRQKAKRLFVYGIFLDEDNRINYYMTDPEYATVLDYCTYGDGIVEAVHCPGRGLSLTGLLVDVPSFVFDKYGKSVDVWEGLDRLEAAYNREIVTTSYGEQVYMYVGKEGMGEVKT